MQWRVAAILTAVWLFFICQVSGDQCETTHTQAPRVVSEDDVAHDLLQRDGKHGLPLSATALTVKLSLHVTGVPEVDTDRGSVEIIGYFGMYWNDPRLMFDYRSPFKKIEHVRLPVSAIWTPDIELYNPVSSGLKILNKKSEVMVNYNGSVIWVPLVAIKALCPPQQHNQNHFQCSLRFGSWTYDSSLLNVDIQQYEDFLSDYIPSGQWTATSTSTERVDKLYEDFGKSYAFVNFTLFLQKNSL